MNIVKYPVNSLRGGLNSAFASHEPWQIVTITTSTVLISVWLYDFLFKDESIVTRAKKTFFRLIKYIPAVRDKIESELQTIAESFERDAEKRTKNLTYITTLPEDGLSKDRIMAILNENLHLSDYDWKGGFASGSVYSYNEELLALVKDVYGKTSYTNPLHADLFPGLCKLEAETIRIGCNLFNGDENACGSMTTGGTESILMACKAYRDYALAVKGITKPEIVVPTTIHSAFDKAAQYLHLKVKSIPVDGNYQVDLRAMKRAISSNTIMLAGSAPNFPYGTMDDIGAISELGLKYNIPVHVDSCLGGFLTCFMDEAGFQIPLCDFRLPGVTSISADTHKYGYAPKGTSLILYRAKKYRHHQFTVTTEWPGGVYGSPTVSGSRAGGNIAVCWAALMHFGKEGYVKATRDIIYNAKYIEKGLRRMKGIFIFGQPVTSVIGIGSRDFEIYRLSDALDKLGWNLNVLQFPSGLHICLTTMHTKEVSDKFLNDVKVSLDEILKEPSIPVEGKMALYGVAQSLPDRSIVEDFTKFYIDSLYYIPNHKK